MARAKCQHDRLWVDTNIAHKEVINGKNMYWCSESCYKAWKENTDKVNAIAAEYDEICALTKDIFGYEFTSYSLLRREFKAWESLTTRANIISYLKENKEWLSRTMSREFSNEYGRIRYFSTVITSKLHDYKPKIEVQETKKIDLCGVGESLYKPRTEKRGLEFLEED